MFPRIVAGVGLGLCGLGTIAAYILSSESDEQAIERIRRSLIQNLSMPRFNHLLNQPPLVKHTLLRTLNTLAFLSACAFQQNVSPDYSSSYPITREEFHGISSHLMSLLNISETEAHFIMNELVQIMPDSKWPFLEIPAGRQIGRDLSSYFQLNIRAFISVLRLTPPLNSTLEFLPSCYWNGSAFFENYRKGHRNFSCLSLSLRLLGNYPLPLYWNCDIFENINFQSANLVNCNFKGALFHNVDFSGAVLKNVSFQNANLNNVIFNSVLLNVSFQNTTFTNCDRFSLYLPESFTSLEDLRKMRNTIESIDDRYYDLKICLMRQIPNAQSTPPPQSGQSAPPSPPFQTPTTQVPGVIPQYLIRVATIENQLIERFNAFNQYISKAKTKQEWDRVSTLERKLQDLLGYAQEEFKRRFPGQPLPR